MEVSQFLEKSERLEQICDLTKYNSHVKFVFDVTFDGHQLSKTVLIN